ncbi:MAG: nucleotidyltransferase domain-containing protein [Acidimicrobiaceae bacterium]|nr:nucleotidyltransferase domain-containing protein [Acidimicrobiaceae bacterium]
MLTDTLAAPSVDDARRASRELVDAGASRVLLFGSVARNQAGPDSDIDLVAIFDNLDYTHRLQRQLDLQTAAQASSGHRVQVHVTDWPEWVHRTRRVSASFEAGIAANTVVLYARPATDVAWGKEIGLATDNTQEALGRLDEAIKALNDLLGHTRLGELEQQALVAGDRASVDHYRHWRLINVCQSAAMAIETSLKSLAALTGEPVRRAHDIDYLLTRTGPHTGAARAALEPLATPRPDTEGNLYHHVTIWRAAGAYLADHPEIDLAATTRLAPGLATAAAQIVTTAAAQIAHTVEDPTAVQPAQQVIAAVTAALNNRNLIEGHAHGRTITPTDHGPAIT